MPHECTNCGRTFPDGSKEMLSGCPDCGGNKFQFAPSAKASAGSGESAAATATDSADDPGGDAAGAADEAGTVERAAETVRDWVSSNANRSGDSSTTGADARSTSGTDDSATAGGGTQPDRADRERADRDRSWPSSDLPGDDADATEPGEFDEWPETARRPEDRSTPPADASAESSRPEPSTDAVDSKTESASDRSIMADSEDDAQADARSAVVSTDDLPDDPVQPDSGPNAASVDPTRATGTADGDDAPPDHGRVVSEPSDEQPSIEELREELNEQFESIKIVSPGQYELNLMELYNREEYIISLQEDGRYVIDVPDSWRSDDE